MAILIDEALEELGRGLECEQVFRWKKRQEALDEDLRGQVGEVHSLFGVSH